MQKSRIENEGYYFKVTDDRNSLLLVTPKRINAVEFIRRELNDYLVHITTDRLIKDRFRLTYFKQAQPEEDEFIDGFRKKPIDLMLVKGGKHPDCIGYYYDKPEALSVMLDVIKKLDKPEELKKLC